ncbi:hypothetical protein ACIBO1_15775 [Micromonospora sp. NPDC049903]|uniref:hypothetical protein n=1 Tax=Micromonospora sp. NPDC049903 TaxID=3364276 RepID=UPI0037B33A35
MVSVTRTRRLPSVATSLLLAAALPLLAALLLAPALPAAAARAAAPVAPAAPRSGPTAVLAAAPQPGPNVFVEVMPSTVEPGHLVGLRASCQDNSVGAIVVSDAFGRVAVQPQRGLLHGTAMVKDRVLPGNYRVKLECRGGETASTMVQVVRQMKPSRGPATGFGGGSGGVASGLLLPGGLALTVTGMVVWIAATRRRGTGG